MTDVDASRRFYAGLGLAFRPELSVDVWAQLSAEAGALGIHDAAVSKGRAPGTVELGFATDERLEDVARRLADAGYAFELFDEDFGRSIRVVDPDGVTIQIQEIDPDTVRRSAAALQNERD
ncbi:VOC family protein [Embleya sp. NPDC001921]